MKWGRDERMWIGWLFQSVGALAENGSRKVITRKPHTNAADMLRQLIRKALGGRMCASNASLDLQETSSYHVNKAVGVDKQTCANDNEQGDQKDQTPLRRLSAAQQITS